MADNCIIRLPLLQGDTVNIFKSALAHVFPKCKSYEKNTHNIDSLKKKIVFLVLILKQ